MPLKPDDLKTVENYRKAIKQDAGHLSEHATTKFWIYKDIELATASGGKQILPLLFSLVDDAAVKAVLKGKQPLCRGICGLRDAQIFFEPQGGTLPSNLKTSVPLLLGRILHPPVTAGQHGPGDQTGAHAAAPYPGLVKYRAALVQFAQAKSQVAAQIQNLRSAIAKEAPDQVEFANELAAELTELNDELAHIVDEAMKGAENEASPATDAIKKKIHDYQAELASSALVRQADDNPLGVPVTIAKTLGGAVAHIREAMPA